MPHKRARHSDAPSCPDGCGLDCAHVPGTQEAGFSCPFEKCGSRCTTQRTFINHLNAAQNHMLTPQAVSDCLDPKRIGQCPLCHTFTVLTLKNELRSHKCTCSRPPASIVAKRRVSAPQRASSVSQLAAGAHSGPSSESQPAVQPLPQSPKHTRSGPSTMLCQVHCLSVFQSALDPRLATPWGNWCNMYCLPQLQPSRAQPRDYSVSLDRFSTIAGILGTVFVAYKPSARRYRPMNPMNQHLHSHESSLNV
jgi:hypothetical protein